MSLLLSRAVYAKSFVSTNSVNSVCRMGVYTDDFFKSYRIYWCHSVATTFSMSYSPPQTVVASTTPLASTPSTAPSVSVTTVVATPTVQPSDPVPAGAIAGGVVGGIGELTPIFPWPKFSNIFSCHRSYRARFLHRHSTGTQAKGRDSTGRRQSGHVLRATITVPTVGLRAEQCRESGVVLSSQPDRNKSATHGIRATTASRDIHAAHIGACCGLWGYRASVMRQCC